MAGNAAMLIVLVLQELHLDESGSHGARFYAHPY